MKWDEKNPNAYKQWYIDNKDRKADSFKKWREKNIDRVKANERRWVDENRGAKNALVAKRALKVACATPKWANLAKIREIYLESDRNTVATGIRHHVDHIYPISGKYVCGLHVHENLRVITAEENMRKLNKMPSDAVEWMS